MTTEPTVFGEDLPPQTGGALSALDGLLDDMGAGASETETLTFDVPGKAGVQVRYRTDVPYENLSAWRKGALDATLPGGMNEMTLGCSVLANQCDAVLADGEPVTDDGKPVTFMSPALLAKLGAARPVDAVRKMYGGKPGYVISTSLAVLRAAGYGVEAVPTPR